MKELVSKLLLARDKIMSEMHLRQPGWKVIWWSKQTKLYKTIIRQFVKRKVYSSFKNNIWGADIANMQLISKYIKHFNCSFVKQKNILQLLMLFKKF